MRTIRTETFEFDKDLEVVFYLGRRFSLESTNLFNILPNIAGRMSIVDESGDDLQKLCPFYHIEAPFITAAGPMPREALYLFLQPAEEDVQTIRPLLERVKGQPAYILAGSLEAAYELDGLLGRHEAVFVVPEYPELKPLHIRDLDSEENPLYLSDLYDLKLYDHAYLGDYLSRLFGLEAPGGHLYKHLDKAMTDRKQELDSLLGDKLPFKALEMAYTHFSSRNLSIREQMEKEIMEGNYRNLPDLMKNLLQEDGNNFAFAYDLTNYLNSKIPADTGIALYENMLASMGTAIDKIYLPLVYEKLAVLRQVKGEFQKSADCYREFCSLATVKNELANIRSDFLRKEIECSLLACNVDYILSRQEEILAEGNLFAEDRARILNYVALALNEKGAYDQALELLAAHGLTNKELPQLKNLLQLNKGDLTLSLLEESRKQLGDAAGPRTLFILDYLKSLLLVRENSSLDSIKLYNQIKDHLHGLSGRFVRKAKVLLYLQKGRALALTGYFRDSLVELAKGIELYQEDFQADIRSLVLTMHQERTGLLMRLGNLEETDAAIEAAVSYATDSSRDYDRLNRIRLELIRLELLEKREQNTEAAVRKLEELFRDNLDRISYRRLKTTMDLQRTSAALAAERDDEALAVAENSWTMFEKDEDLEVSRDLLDILSRISESKAGKDQPDWQKRMISKYFMHKEEPFHTKGALALKQLADLQLAGGQIADAFENYSLFAAGAEGRPSTKLEEANRGSLLGMAEILFERKEYQNAKDQALKISGETAADKKAWQDLLITKCDDNMGKTQEPIQGYEAWLRNYTAKEVRPEDLLFVLDRLASLLAGAGRNLEAISYLDRLLELEEKPLRQLQARVRKADLVYPSDKERAAGLYREALVKYKDNEEEGVFELLMETYARTTADIGLIDFGLCQEYVARALGEKNSTNRIVREAACKILKSGAIATEASGEEDREKWIRQQLVSHFRTKEGLEHERDLAYSYFRLLKISLENDPAATAEERYKELLAYAAPHPDATVQEYVQNGIFEMGLHAFNRKDFLEAKRILGELLAKRESPDALYYYANAILATGEKKEGTKEFNKLFEKELLLNLDKDLYFQAVLEKISLEREDRSLFSRNLKKLVKELEAWILPGLSGEAEGFRKLELWYQLGLLYKDLKKEKKAQEIFRNLINQYQNLHDEQTELLLKKVYASIN